jgi:hypothetical protein
MRRAFFAWRGEELGGMGIDRRGGVFHISRPLSRV